LALKVGAHFALKHDTLALLLPRGDFKVLRKGNLLHSFDGGGDTFEDLIEIIHARG
jgi:hypothetical protein